MRTSTTRRVVRAAALCFAAAGVLILTTGSKPVVNTLVPASGPARTLVMIQGIDLSLSDVVWDAGLATEKIVPGGYLGATMFSVPSGAALGAHPVVVRNKDGGSKVMNFTVTAPQPFGGPRIDAVTIAATPTFASGKVTATLYVQGANIDVGAVVRVDGADVATNAHKGLRNDLFGVDPEHFGYPIHHYLALLAVPPEKPAGSPLSIVVRNLDGTLSAPFRYVLPSSAATLDSDGDALLDSWESKGFDANNDNRIDVDLPRLGTSPFRRDILVEIDIMKGLTHAPIASTAGTPGTFEMARRMFAAAPIMNPGPANGINLIIDASGTVPYFKTIGFDVPHNPSLSAAKFSTVKAAHFDSAKRDKIYHYVIWGDQGYDPDSSGNSDLKFDANKKVETPGDDCIVSFDSFPISYYSIRSQVETLTHELGHNLGQQHGGRDNIQYKPNYWSVMAYTWQLRTGKKTGFRQKRFTCVPLYYGAAGAAEPKGALPSTVNSIVDYSAGMGPMLSESNNSLNEVLGICGQPVDWNGDQDTNDPAVSADIDGDGVLNGAVADFANWRALRYDGPALNGSVP